MRTRRVWSHRVWVCRWRARTFLPGSVSARAEQRATIDSEPSLASLRCWCEGEHHAPQQRHAVVTTRTTDEAHSATQGRGRAAHGGAQCAEAHRSINDMQRAQRYDNCKKLQLMVHVEDCFSRCVSASSAELLTAFVAVWSSPPRFSAAFLLVSRSSIAPLWFLSASIMVSQRVSQAKQAEKRRKQAGAHSQPRFWFALPTGPSPRPALRV